MDKPPEPFRGDDIRNPQSEKAVAGRLNCAGISRLYLSSTEDIAAAEVRAITADFVTIAKFALREPIAVFDFRQINFRAKDESSELLSYIGRIIATPVFGHDNYESILSQWITEYIEKSGAHALIFPSVMRGRPKEEHSFIHSILKISPREFFNVCAFYPSQFELLEASPIVTRVRELTLTVMDDVRFYKLRALDEIQEKLKQGGTAALKSEEVPPSSAPDGAPPSGSS